MKYDYKYILTVPADPETIVHSSATNNAPSSRKEKKNKLWEITLDSQTRELVCSPLEFIIRDFSSDPR